MRDKKNKKEKQDVSPVALGILAIGILLIGAIEVIEHIILTDEIQNSLDEEFGPTDEKSLDELAKLYRELLTKKRFTTANQIKDIIDYRVMHDEL